MLIITLVLLQTHYLRRLNATFAGNFFLEMRAFSREDDEGLDDLEKWMATSDIFSLTDVGEELDDSEKWTATSDTCSPTDVEVQPRKLADCCRFSSDFLPVASSLHTQASDDTPFETGGAVFDGFVMRDVDQPSGSSRNIEDEEVAVLGLPGEYMISIQIQN